MQRPSRILLPVVMALLLTAGAMLWGYDATTTQIVPDKPELSQSHQPPQNLAGSPKPAAPSKAYAAASLTSNPYLIADVAEESSPAVVFISVEWPAPPTDDRLSPFLNDPFFRFWFGDDFSPFPSPGQQAPRRSAGTGFIIDKEGHILTNQHVVGDPGEGQTIMVRITTADYDGEVEAELVGSDYQLDLAVLKIKKPDELTEFPTLRLGDSDKSRPGEFVIAIGNPYGEQFDHTVTIGVLSAKGRQISIPDYERQTVKYYQNLMQTDAAINPGNSGGPLLNIKGEVIGINTAVNAQAQGIGFAIPINTAKKVLNDLIEKGKVERGRPWIGIEYESAESYFGVRNALGIVIVRVLEGEPADKAGLKSGDYVYAIDNSTIQGSQDFIAKVQQMQPGQTVVFHIKREGRKMQIPVVVGERPDDKK